MYISLQELEVRSVRFDVDIPTGEIDFDAKLVQASPLHAEGSAHLQNEFLREIRVEGDVKVLVQGNCDRCLEPAPFSLENHFDLMYMPVSRAKVGGEDKIDEVAAEIGFYEGNGLELNDIVREVVLLALPMQLTCREDCQGICPLCGQNRNQRECDCKPVAGDNRWSKLEQLRGELGPLN